MADDAQFVCTACDIDYSGDTDKVMTSCRLCGKLHCSDCVDEHGRCVDCTENESG